MANTDYGAIPLTLAEGVSQKLNQKLGVSTGFKPSEWADAINLLGRLPNKTVSGSICHFTDGVNVPLVNGKFGITAYQDGTGTPSPSNVRAIHGYTGMDIVRAGKNLLPPLASSFESNGIKWDLNADKSIHIHGTATGNSVYDFGRGAFRLHAGTYTVNSAGNNIAVAVYENSSPASVIKGGGGTFTITETKDIFIRVAVLTDSVVDTTFYPQLELGSSATAYSAYNGTTYPLTWQNECYGGYIDYARGKKVTTHRKIDFSDFTPSTVTAEANLYRITFTAQVYDADFNYRLGLCNNLDFKTSYSDVNGTDHTIGFNNPAGLQIILHESTLTTEEEVTAFLQNVVCVYPLANPTEEDITLPVISVLEGENNIWNTCGDSDVTYIASSAKTGINFSADVNSGWSATDATRTMMTITASGDAQIIFGKGATGITNCSNNHAYMKLIKNSTEIWTKTLPQNTTTKLDDIPDISLADGDQLKLVFGYASTHSNINMHFNNGYLQIAGNADVKGLAGVSNTYFSLIGFS